MSVAKFPTACPPVLVVAFNRPDTTERVIEALRIARPAKVFFAVDGPRADRPRDAEAVRRVQALAGSFDWQCELRTLFREANLGCKLAVSQAVSWFFSEVEAGVILEDDCVAHPSFFPFAAELLERYRDDERVMMISGDNFQFGARRGEYSYYFSRYNHIWGWASWRRAWQLYDHQMRAWPLVKQGGWLLDYLQDEQAVRYWSDIFDATHAEQNTSWAYRWTFACWMNAGLTVLPNVNLVSNVGFGSEATHTVAPHSPIAGMPVAPMPMPLEHPPFLIRDAVADSRTERLLFSSPRGLRGIPARLKRLVLRP